MPDINIACVSDIHLGHKRNTTAEIISNLMLAFRDDASFAFLDILFLAGDVFDGLLSLPNEDVPEIDIWIGQLLNLCKKHNVKLRVLEGTPSHDWCQSQRFITINEIAAINADVKYVKELSIEYIDDLGLNVLYIPDEWESTTEKTFEQVQAALAAKGLTQVDLAIMHGQFEYQLPEHVKAQKHNSNDYLSIVSRLIFIGHVHVHTRHQRIVAQGSFDRLSHGEEGPKGHVRARLKDNGECDVVFVENTGAKQFITVSCLGLELEATIKKVSKVAATLKPGTYIRVEADHTNHIFQNMEVLVTSFPLLVWSKKPIEPETQETAIEDIGSIYVPITLTKDNLSGLLMERLLAKELAPAILSSAQQIILDAL